MIDLEKIWTSTQLPTLPSVAVKLLELSRDPDSGIADIIKTIKTDPAISAKILKWTNSSYFGFSSKVTSIDRAVPLLGGTVVTSLALSFTLSESAMTRGPLAEYFKKYWKQSVVQAVAAELLGGLNARTQKKDYFLAGLLMDLGRLAMLKTVPDEYLDVLQQPSNSREELQQVETRMLGFDHVEVGMRLMVNWNLPAELINSVQFHHATLDALLEQKSDPDFSVIKVVALASSIGDYLCLPMKGGALVRMTQLGNALFEFSESQRDDLVRQVITRVGEIGDLFSLDSDELGDPSELLAQANEQLVQLTVREHVASTQAVAKSQVMGEQKKELESNQHALQSQAIHDPLTNLYNRQFFDESLSNEIMRCQRDALTVGVIFCDIDHFKDINDTHGHLFGDEVLKRISIAITDAVRKSDIVARFGGEEFVVAVSQPTEKGILAVAERIRSRVEAEKIFNDETHVPVTVSVGAALALPKIDKSELSSELVAAADEAMYDSKRNGRNQVHVRSLLSDDERRLIANVSSRRFSRWIVNQKILSIQEISTALVKRSKSQVRVSDLALSEKYLSSEDADRILTEQKQTNERFGEIAIRLDLLDEDQLAQLLALQHEDPADLCHIIVDLKLLEQDYASALLKQYRDMCQNERRNIRLKPASKKFEPTVLANSPQAE